MDEKREAHQYILNIYANNVALFCKKASKFAVFLDIEKRTTGLSDYWAVGLLGCRTIGL